MAKTKERKIIGKCCINCDKFIDPKEKYVDLATYNLEHVSDDHQYFHFQCFIDYFNERVRKKAMASIKMMQEKAINIFESPLIKSLISQVQGSEVALKMLHTPLDDKVVSKKIVIKKIKDDRKQRSGKKGKAQVCEV
jgi:hypothetical protein